MINIYFILLKKNGIFTGPYRINYPAMEKMEEKNRDNLKITPPFSLSFSALVSLNFAHFLYRNQ
jgi:hypothetical protein